jgi:hypothetical protein
MMSDRQAGPSAATADLVSGKPLVAGPEPYRRAPNAPTGITNMMRGYMKTRATWTADDAAVDLRVNRKSVIDAVKNLMKTGEVELAEEPAKPAAPRVYRAAPTFETAAKPKPRKAAPAATPKVQITAQVRPEDLDDAIADLLAMHTGEEGVDPVSAALNRVLLAAEAARAEYLKCRHDPLLDHLDRQVEEAHAAITAWEERRREKR